MKSFFLFALMMFVSGALAVTDRLERAVEVQCFSEKTGNLYTFFPSYGEITAESNDGERLIDDDGYTDRITRLQGGVQVDLAHHSSPDLVSVILIQMDATHDVIKGSIFLTHFPGPDGKFFPEDDKDLDCTIIR